VYSTDKKGRPFFIIPFPIEHAGEAARHLLIGTTDDKTWTSIYPTREEVDHLIESANKVIPTLNLNHNAVFHAYSGFRPLPQSNKSAGAVTRKHIIRRVNGSRIFHIIGGKITTYRSLSEQASDQVVKALKREPESGFLSRMQNKGRAVTHQQALPGGANIRDITAFKQTNIPLAAKSYGVAPEVVNELINRYGSLYTEVLDLTHSHTPDPAKGAFLKAPLTQAAPLILAQVLHAIRYENAETLMDIMTNSLKADLLPGAGLDGLDTAAAILAQEKSLTPEEVEREKAAYRNYIALNDQWRTNPT
jgi:glycerol-3-phosphate dehydrogenase